MIIEYKTKTRLISNRRNRMLLTLVSPVCTLTPLDAAKYKWFIPKEYRLSNEKIYQRGIIQTMVIFLEGILNCFVGCSESWSQEEGQGAQCL